MIHAHKRRRLRALLRVQFRFRHALARGRPGRSRNASHSAQGAIKLGNKLVHGKHGESLAKKRAPEGARLQSQYVRLERVAHRYEDVSEVRTIGQRGFLGRALWTSRDVGPSKSLVGLVFDLRDTETEGRALRKRPLVAEVPHLGSGVIERKSLEFLRSSIACADLPGTQRDCQTERPLLRLDVAESRLLTGNGSIPGLVRVRLVRASDVRNPEVIATSEGPTAIRLADRRPVLRLHGCGERACTAAQAGPGKRCGPSARIFSHDSRRRGGGGGGFVLVRLVSRLELHVGEERRLIEERALETPPQRIAKVVSSCTRCKYV